MKLLHPTKVLSHQDAHTFQVLPSAEQSAIGSRNREREVDASAKSDVSNSFSILAAAHSGE
jgi:hypothetical protein